MLFKTVVYRLLATSVCCAAPAAAALDTPTVTMWDGRDGDWFDASAWSAGIPTFATAASIAQGSVGFSADLTAGGLAIGSAGAREHQKGSLVGTGAVTTLANTWVGRASASGVGSTTSGVGELRIQDGDLTVITYSPLPGGLFPLGELEVANASGTGTDSQATATGFMELGSGSIKSRTVEVARAGGTGTRTHATATGAMNLDYASIEASAVVVGLASGTGSAIGEARGSVSMKHGDINLHPPDSANVPRLTIGHSGGTGEFVGDAVGELKLFDGSITGLGSSILVGVTSPIAEASGKASGLLLVDHGSVSMSTFALGVSYANGGPATGRFEQYYGMTTGDTFTQGSRGTVVLGIGGPEVGTGYSQIHVDSAQLDGVLEARFIDGFHPRPGDVFDLFHAGTIQGNFSTLVSGIDLEDYPGLRFEVSDRRIRLVIPVPEPPTAAILSPLLLVAARRARRSR